MWVKKLEEHGVAVRFSPVRHPQSNPSERVMRELSKFFRIYCRDIHKKWAEVLPHVEKWINCAAASSTGYSPMELMFDGRKLSVFDNVLPELDQSFSGVESLEVKWEKAFSRIKRKAEERERRRRRGNASWNPKLGGQSFG
jgi:hypothetical protein